MPHPLPSREREGARAKRGKGEGAGEDRCLDSRETLTRPLWRAPSPGAGEGHAPCTGGIRR
ncbi:hypothetical protein Sp245p_18820 (plasmid) [Azospirillum baldaniorum]|nr:hypothetical protein Sp245p_18820 [Azospirillum baldaniorum]NUB07889.1 hypothetical protein [Azospirillum baldaniorum]